MPIGEICAPGPQLSLSQLIRLQNSEVGETDRASSLTRAPNPAEMARIATAMTDELVRELESDEFHVSVNCMERQLLESIESVVNRKCRETNMPRPQVVQEVLGAFEVKCNSIIKGNGEGLIDLKKKVTDEIRAAGAAIALNVANMSQAQSEEIIAYVVQGMRENEADRDDIQERLEKAGALSGLSISEGDDKVKTVQQLQKYLHRVILNGIDDHRGTVEDPSFSMADVDEAALRAAVVFVSKGLNTPDEVGAFLSAARKHDLGMAAFTGGLGQTGYGAGMGTFMYSGLADAVLRNLDMSNLGHRFVFGFVAGLVVGPFDCVTSAGANEVRDRYTYVGSQKPMKALKSSRSICRTVTYDSINSALATLLKNLIRAVVPVMVYRHLPGGEILPGGRVVAPGEVRETLRDGIDFGIDAGGAVFLSGPGSGVTRHWIHHGWSTAARDAKLVTQGNLGNIVDRSRQPYYPGASDALKLFVKHAAASITKPSTWATTVLIVAPVVGVLFVGHGAVSSVITGAAALKNVTDAASASAQALTGPASQVTRAIKPGEMLDAEIAGAITSAMASGLLDTLVSASSTPKPDVIAWDLAAAKSSVSALAMGGMAGLATALGNGVGRNFDDPFANAIGRAFARLHKFVRALRDQSYAVTPTEERELREPGPRRRASAVRPVRQSAL